MEALWRLIQHLARIGAWAGGGLLILAALTVSTEVLLRKGLGALVGYPILITGTNEIAAYLFAIGTSWSLAYALVTRGHVRIDTLYERLSPHIRAILDIIALLALALFVAVLVERAYDLVADSYLSDRRSATPLRVKMAIPQIAWFAGIGRPNIMMVVAMLIAFLRSLLALAHGDPGTVSRTIGVPSQKEEIRNELEGLGIGRPAGATDPTPPNGPKAAPTSRGKPADWT
ncbi:MAG TPA: TRAP transporter small permease subunit [Hyphomicrobiaceae bacterium]|nr:TRAP transporter small permease subunit [Hyphomicrobiaceae bacterium]